MSAIAFDVEAATTVEGLVAGAVTGRAHRPHQQHWREARVTVTLSDGRKLQETRSSSRATRGTC
ncbi:MAG: hypothetical protein HYR50_14450 [Candidatus Rokubacteria bacterium]|nr:hypothetical protein [Candidatus Rokubacteria bacterium]